MTYNVHSCRGADGEVSIERIAGVISSADPDVATLQELDMGLVRSGSEDQAERIAEALEMECRFHPCLELEEGLYGNAVLSKYPATVLKTGELPTLPKRTPLEKRGALMVEVDLDGTKVRILNTHLGLNRKERLFQASTLTGRDWLAGPLGSPPLVVCGDLNMTSVSRVYRSFSESLVDVQRAVDGRRPRATWPGAWPAVRLDYVFVSPDVTVEGFRVVDDRPAREASDHLPLVADLAVRTDRERKE